MKNLLAFFGICLLTALAPHAYAVLAETPFDYYTGFEADENPAFNPGALPQNGWTSSGTSQIATDDAFSGNQSLRIEAEAIVDKPLEAQGRSVVWLEGWYNTTPEPEYPDLDLLDSGSSLVLFHSADGISCLDGDGNGSGTWVATGVEIDASQWYRITIRQDYASQTWDCFVDGRLRARGLGFKDNITELSGFRLQQGKNNPGHLDEFAVQTDPLIPPYATNELFRFAAQWGRDKNQGPINETDFTRFNRLRDSQIDEVDLVEVLKGWHWDK